MSNMKSMTSMDKTSTSKEVKTENCLVVLYSPNETGASKAITRIRTYYSEGEALMAYAETPCYWSQLCTEDMASKVAEMAEYCYSIYTLTEDRVFTEKDWEEYIEMCEELDKIDTIIG